MEVSNIQFPSTKIIENYFRTVTRHIKIYLFFKSFTGSSVSNKVNFLAIYIKFIVCILAIHIKFAVSQQFALNL